ncbi:MAG: nuclear transport factor 2 family protein [Pseudomonadota bacterium]
MSETTGRDIALIQSRFAIEDLMTVYAERVDGGDMEGVGELFARGCVVMPDGSELAGAQAVRDGYVASVVLYDGNGERADYIRHATTPRTRHLVANRAFDFNADLTAADCRCAFLVMQQIGERYEPIVGGRYLDRFENDGTGWHFVRRQVVIDSAGDTSHHAAQQGG